MLRLTLKIRVFPTQTQIFRTLGQEYIETVNQLVKQASIEGRFPRVTTKDVDANLPSAVLNQAIRDAKSVFRKSQKLGKVPVLKKPVYYVNNQNYKIRETSIEFPIFQQKRTQRVSYPLQLTNRDRQLLKNAKLGLMRVVEKSGKWYAQVSIEIPTCESTGENEMAVDLGIKVPAVAVTSTGKTHFFGNGRQNKYVRRMYESRRRKLGKLKKLSAIKKLANKEQRWMKNENHKISRQIVNQAEKECVSIIKLECLANIRQTARTSRKNAKNLHRWSFYQLQQFITYKAKLAGIRVVVVDPAYTSQTCPKCDKRNHAKDRTYQCSCGFHSHRDRVGAINILRQPVADGNSLSA